MPIPIPIHVQNALGIGSPLEVDDLAAAAEVDGFSQDVFGLSGSEFAQAAERTQSAPLHFVIESTDRTAKGWKLLETTLDGTRECVSTTTPPTTEMPPTAIAQLMVEGWFSDSRVVNDRKIPPSLNLMAFPIVDKVREFMRLIAEHWLTACPILQSAASPPEWFHRSQFKFVSSTRIFGAAGAKNSRYQELLLEVISEVKAKWRLLSLYRVLEHGYLTEVLQTLVDSFYDSPKEAVNAAKDGLENEINQLLNLAEKSGLQAGFSLFNEECDLLAAAGNTFIVALDQSALKAKQFANRVQPWQKGVVRLYKTRCSIVHAGSSSPIIESYCDSSEYLDATLMIVEWMVVHFLGITLS